jgi:hypothetical protein
VVICVGGIALAKNRTHGAPPNGRHNENGEWVDDYRKPPRIGKPCGPTSREPEEEIACSIDSYYGQAHTQDGLPVVRSLPIKIDRFHIFLEKTNRHCKAERQWQKKKSRPGLAAPYSPFRGIRGIPTVPSYRCIKR